VEIKDIKRVLTLAVLVAENVRDDAEREENYKAIEAVETWLMEIGALPPR